MCATHNSDGLADRCLGIVGRALHWELAWTGKLPVLVMPRPRDTQCTHGPGHRDTISSVHINVKTSLSDLQYHSRCLKRSYLLTRVERTVWTQKWLMSIEVFCLSGIRSNAWVFEENYENGQSRCPGQVATPTLWNCFPTYIFKTFVSRLWLNH